MPIVAAYMVPHPPMIIPQVGRGSEKQITKTIRAYEAVAAGIAGIRPETIIVTSPHAVLYADYFHISPGEDDRRLRQFSGAGGALCGEVRHRTREGDLRTCEGEGFPGRNAR